MHCWPGQMSTHMKEAPETVIVHGCWDTDLHARGGISTGCMACMRG